MRRLIALTTVLTLSLTSVPFAAGATRGAVRQNADQSTGTVKGEAKDAQGSALANYTVRIRNLANGSIAGSTTTGAAGEYSFVGLTPGAYAVEIASPSGQILGTSAAITLTAGTTATITVTASAASLAADGAAGGAMSGAAAARGSNTALMVTILAGAAGITGLVVAKNTPTASGSR